MVGHEVREVANVRSLGPCRPLLELFNFNKSEEPSEDFDQNSDMIWLILTD